MPATKTPPKGGKPDKLMRDAIMVALKREATDADGKKTRKLNQIATKLVELAVNGDMQAIKEIGDRVDGRPAQAMELTGKDGGPVEIETNAREQLAHIVSRHTSAGDATEDTGGA